MVQELSFSAIHLVTTAWEKVRQKHPNVGEQVLIRLFDLDPAVKRLFADNGMGTKIHGKRIAEFIEVANILLGPDVDTLSDFLSSMGARHLGRGVTKEHFVHLGQALCNVMKDHLAVEWNLEIEQACQAIFSEMTRCILTYM